MGFGGGSGFSPSRTIVEASTKTGNDVGQKHQFTGSVDITGDLNLNGAPVGGGGGTPGGATTQVQYNNAGSFAGSANLVFDGTNLGIGVTDPDSALEVLSTTTQQKWSYDADSFATLTVADDSVTTLASGESGNIVIDAAGDIFLEADGGQIYMGDPGGATKLKFDVQATTAYIDLNQDAPLIFRLGLGGVSEIARFDQATDSFRLATDSPVQFRDTATSIHSPSANVLTLTGPTVDVAGTFSLNSANVTSTAPELNLLDASVVTAPSEGIWTGVERVAVINISGSQYDVGPHVLGVTLPDKAILTNATLDVFQGLVGGAGSTISLTTTGNVHSSVPAPIDFFQSFGGGAQPIGIFGSEEGVGLYSGGKLNGASTLTFTVAVDPLTAGGMNVYVHYIMGT
tara:strand:- start:13 stop:1212 length:1200 start_codon:yes stop_codon:yes gene_type:complete